MTDNVEERLRASLRGVELPAAPDSIRHSLEQLPTTAPQRLRSPTRPLATLLGAAALMVAALFGLSVLTQGTAAPGVGAASPGTVDGVPVQSVAEVLAARAAGSLGSEKVVLTGFWTDRTIAHSCGMPEEPFGELEISCHDGEFGITEREEPILRAERDGSFVAAEGPHLTPWVPEELRGRLFGLPSVDGKAHPPVSIVVSGHFGDERAAECRSSARQTCLDRFVLDSIVAFNP